MIEQQNLLIMLDQLLNRIPRLSVVFFFFPFYLIHILIDWQSN